MRRTACSLPQICAIPLQCRAVLGDVCNINFSKCYPQDENLFFNSTVPSLILNLTEVPSLVPQSLTLYVDVNERSNCANQGNISILGIVVDGSDIIALQEADFVDGPVTFESVPTGNYTCLVGIVDQTGAIESSVHEIPCGNIAATG